MSSFDYLRLRPFDVTTAKGRSAERYRRAAWATVTSFGSRAASMAFMLLSVGLTVGYLGPVRFGAWAVLASLVGMLSFMDLGVGNALINRVANAAAAGTQGDVRRVVAGGLVWMALIGAAAATLLTLATAVLPWGRVMHLSDPATILEVSLAATVFCTLFGLNLLSSAGLKLLIGQQRAHEAHLLTFIGATAACVCVWIAAAHEAGISVLLVCGFGAQTFVAMLSLPLLARRLHLSHDCLLPAMQSERGPLLRTSGVFLVLQLGTMVASGGDSLLLSATRGAEAVASMAVAQRLFQFASQPVMVLNGPLWAAYADAHSRGDKAFMRETLLKSLVWSTAGSSVIALVLIASSPWILPAWTDNAVDVPIELLLAFALWATLESTGNAFAMYLNGAGLIREQVIVVAAFCAMSIPLKILCANHFGAPGLIFAGCFSFLLTELLMYSTMLRRRVLAPLRVSSE